MWPFVLLSALLVSGAGPLRWDAPSPACPDAVEVDERLRPLLGEQGLEVEADAHVVPSASGFRAELGLRWRGHVDHRRLEAEDCGRLADAVVLLVAVMADPVRTSAELEVGPDGAERAVPELPSPRPKPPRSAPVMGRSEPEPEAAPPASETQRDDPPLHRDRGLSLGMGVIVDGGTLPRVAAGSLVALVWRTAWVRLFGEGLVLPPTRVRSSAPYARGRVLVGGARLGACLRLGRSPVEVPLCAGAEVGTISASGFGLSGRGRARDPWLAGIGRVAISISPSRNLSLTAGVEVGGSFRRFEYRYSGELLHATAPVAVRGLLGVEFRMSSHFPARPENP